MYNRETMTMPQQDFRNYGDCERRAPIPTTKPCYSTNGRYTPAPKAKSSLSSDDYHIVYEDDVPLYFKAGNYKRASKGDKQLTCATVIISQDKKHILFGKITLQNRYDLPKGRLEANETPLEAAIREVHEETGLTIPKEAYRVLRVLNLENLPYNRDKDISVYFVYDRDGELLKEINRLRCSTYFTLNEYQNIDKSRYTPEQLSAVRPDINGFKLLKISKLIYNNNYTRAMLNKSMYYLFRNPIVTKTIKALSFGEQNLVG